MPFFLSGNIKKNPGPFFLCALIMAVPALTLSQETPSGYASLLARVKSGDLSVDFQRLRFSYMDSPERHAAKDISSERREMFAAVNGKDYKKAIQKADAVLANEFVDMDAHAVEAAAHREIQETEKADFHQAVFSGLLKSITDSGDGKSKKSAFVVISVDEEYVVLRILGLRPNKQSVAHDGAHSYDVMETIDLASGNAVTLYFNVDIPFKHYLE
jgi:Domain of unknown function (DUF4919)